MESDVSGGRICVAAVQQFTLYVNGHLAGEGGMKPVTLELGDFFHQGENLIAVHVHNPNPYPDSNICSVEKLPADRMISLLLEGELYLKDMRENPVCIQSNSEWLVSNQYEESWENLSRRLQARRHDPARQLWAERDGVWLYAWERGNVPLQPWGDLPLYGERLSWPRRVAYQITLPVGRIIRKRLPIS